MEKTVNTPKKITNYHVSFFKKGEKSRDKDEFLGSVDVSDLGTNQSLPLVAKAFRQAPARCSDADIVRMEKR